MANSLLNYSISRYSSPIRPRYKWQVTGPVPGSQRQRRWLFVSHDDAEAHVFVMNAKATSEASGNTSTPNAPKVVGTRLPRIAPVVRVGFFAGTGFALAVVLSALIVDLHIFHDSRAATDVLFSDDFEFNPIVEGWTDSPQGIDWSTDKPFAGKHCLSNATGQWISPMLPSEPLRWYRLNFKVRTEGKPERSWTNSFAQWTIRFFDDAGRPLDFEKHGSIFEASEWTNYEMRFRAPAIPGGGGSLRPVTMQLIFEPAARGRLFVDDLLIKRTEKGDVVRWADGLYGELRVSVDYKPKSPRWTHLPQTMEKLRHGQRLRIVAATDGTQGAVAGSPLDPLLERIYPGSTVEILPITVFGLHEDAERAKLQRFIVSSAPDLLLLEGHAGAPDAQDLGKLIDALRLGGPGSRTRVEVLLLNEGWLRNSGSQVFAKEPPGAVLAQVEALSRVAREKQIEFLDLRALLLDFILGPAAAAGVGPPGDAQGQPYAYWCRDPENPNQFGEQIVARLLATYFSPAP